MMMKTYTLGLDVHRTFIKDNVRRPIAAATATTPDAAAAAAANGAAPFI